MTLESMLKVVVVVVKIEEKMVKERPVYQRLEVFVSVLKVMKELDG